MEQTVVMTLSWADVVLKIILPIIIPILMVMLGQYYVRENKQRTDELTMKKDIELLKATKIDKERHDDSLRRVYQNIEPIKDQINTIGKDVAFIKGKHSQ